MKRIVWHPRFSWLAAVIVTGLAVVILARAVAEAKRPATEPPQPQLPVPVAQVNPQRAANNVNIVQTVPANVLRKRDFSKSAIEFPTEQLLAAQTTPFLAAPAVFVNPKVEPGKVHWHKDFATACAAAKKSNKPVLLFQMMGNLDERFC